jgi:hypothetical protein
MGAKAVNAFEDLIRSKERRALDLVEQEVDEIAELVQTAGNLKVFEKMSRDLGIDVQNVGNLVDFEVYLQLRWGISRGSSP